MTGYVTLVEMLLSKKTETNKGITIIRGESNETFISYADLLDRALKVLYGLQQRGIGPKEEVVFQIEDPEKLIYTFWACILGGMIPVPLSLASSDDYRHKLVNVWRILSRPTLITDHPSAKLKEFMLKNPEYIDIVESINKRTILYEDLTCFSAYGSINYGIEKHEIAFIQFSSGSTGDPKGVILTHTNLLVNVTDAIEASETTEQDSYLSWMPLTHDMGMIGAHFIPMVANSNQYIMPTNVFIRRPMLWLMKAAEHQTTVLMSPNFGYKFFLSSFDEDADFDWDLSKVRLIYNGAEPISTELCQQFTEKMSRFGLRSNCMFNVYGLAEATVAVSFPISGEPVKSIHLDRRVLNVGNRVIEIDMLDKYALTFVELGSPLRRCQVRITALNNVVMPDCQIGHIQIKGANVTSGYYNSPDKSNSVINSDGWLNTGDLGFMRNGRLVVTGRAKDIIFINGQNIYPHDLERVAERVEGIELGKVAACGIYNEKVGTDEIVIFVLHKGTLKQFVPSAIQVKSIINQLCGYEVKAVLPIRRILKTTSGKVQRYVLAQKYGNGEFDQVQQELEHLIELEMNLREVTVPSTSMEKMLASIWSEVLDIQTISTKEHFFEIGGNSIKASKVLAKIRNKLHVDLQMDSLFRNPNIEMLAEEIELLDKINVPSPVKISGRKVFPLSSAQKRLYVLHQYETNETSYNLPFVFSLMGTLDLNRFMECCRMLLARHSVFRTLFEFREGELVQRILPETDVKFEIEYRASDETELDVIISSFVRPFDLQSYPLWRAVIVQTEDNRYYFLLDMHHIISDGTSIGILMDELTKLYKGEQLAPLSLEYTDFANWQEGLLQDHQYVKKQEKFWLGVYEGGLPILELPTDYPRRAVRTYSGDLLKFNISLTLLTKLSKFAQKTGTTLFTVLFSAYNAMLHKYTDQEDIIVGTLLAGRLHESLLDSVGMFVNTVAVRSQPEARITFLNFLEQMKGMLLQVFQHQDYPFEEILHKLDVKRDLSRNPLFDTMFVLQNMKAEPMQLKNVHVTQNPIENKVSRFDLSWYVIEKDNGLRIEVEYSTDLFMKSTIERMSHHFVDLLEQIVTNPEIVLGDLQLGTESEIRKILSEYQQLSQPGTKWTSLQEAFEHHAALKPESPAITYEGLTLTYDQLNQTANQLAMVLKKRGVVANTLVPLLLHRSCDMVVAQLAVWKAGGAFVPIDPEYPEERVQFMLENIDAKYLISSSGTYTGMSFTGELIIIDDPFMKEESVCNLEIINQPEDLAYIIYTSGSTGFPKGVMVEHRNLLAVSESWDKAYELGKMPLRLLQLANFSFDVSIGDLARSLFYGGHMIICPQEIRSDVKRLYHYLLEHRITIFESVPSLISPLMEYVYLQGLQLNDLKVLIMGSDVCSKADYLKIAERFGKNCRIINSYGVTEATIDSSYYESDHSGIPSESVPIGKPMSHARMYVVDRFGKMLPIGVPGELCIGGTGVGRGYIGPENHLKGKFVPDTYLPDSTMYRTGDIAKWLPDGNLVFIGRRDNQIKINGYRIETGEVEAGLLEHPLISHAAVVDRDSVLCAYYVANESLSEKEVQGYLLNRLPYYMVPASLMQLEFIPLTTNGKVDKRSLPKPQMRVKGSDLEMPGNETERILSIVWKEVLGNEGDLSITDNYFALGGDSIKAIQIISRLYQYGLQTEIKSLLRYPTIKELSPHIITVEDQADQSQPVGTVPLLPIHHWFFSRNYSNVNHWNQAVLLFKREGLKESPIKKAFEHLIQHHDALRISFFVKDGEVVQTYRESDESNLPLSVYHNLNPEAMEEVINELHNGLDLEKGPLFRLGLFHHAEGDNLCIIIHHLLVDGVSWRIILEDFWNSYESFCQNEPLVLSRKTNSIKKWAEALTQYAAGKEILKEIPYWRSVEQEISEWQDAVWQMNTANHTTFRGSRTVHLSLDQQVTETFMQEACRVYRMESGEMILAALSLALSDWSGNRRVLIQAEGHGRELEGVNVSRTVGWFTSMFPVLLDIGDGEDLYSQLKMIKEDIRRIPNKGFGYGVLKYLVPREKTEGTLSFALSPRISFNYLGHFEWNDADSEMNISFLSTGEWIGADNERPFSLNINAYLSGGRLAFILEYDPIIHQDNDIEALTNLLMSRIPDINRHAKEVSKVLMVPSDFRTTLLEEDLDYISASFPDGVHDVYPLSPSQRGILYHAQAQPDSGVYHQQMSFHWEGPLSLSSLKQALDFLVLRHPALRTVFLHEDLTVPLQVVLKSYTPSVTFRNLLELSSDEREAAIDSYKQEAKVNGFDIAKTPPLNISLLQIGEHSHTFIWDVHHLLFDGWSLGIIMEEFFTLYASLVKGTPHVFPDSIPFSEYIGWLERRDDSQSAHYWSGYLAGYDQTASILANKQLTLQESKEYAPADYRFKLSVGTSLSLLEFSKNQGVTLNQIIQAIWGIVLSKYNQTEDVVFGSVLSGRTPQITGIERIVGLFINTLPVRIRYDSNTTILELLRKTQENAFLGDEEQHYPLYEIQNLSPLKSKLLDHVLIFENYPLERGLVDRLSNELQIFLQMEELSELTNYNLNIIIYPGEQLEFHFRYNGNVYNDFYLKRLEAHLLQAVHAVLHKPDALIKDIMIWTKEELKHSMVLQGQAMQYDAETTIYQLFEERVVHTPNKAALYYKGETFSFDELNRRANRLAHHLRNHHSVRPDDVVGVMCRPSDSLMVALLAVLKAGGAYVPLDPAYPEERIRYVIGDSRIKLLLTEEDMIPAYSQQVLCLDIHSTESYLEWPNTNLDSLSNHTHLAYVIYTSGSTGKPKGVMVEHGNVVHFFTGMNRVIQPVEQDVMLAVTSISFDISVLELFWTLTNGITVVLKDSDIFEGLENFNDYLSLGKTQMEFSLFFFSSHADDQDPDKYKLLIDATKYGDRNGYSAVWVPERHFHEFGGLYPNPSVVASALAMVSDRIQLRAGSVVSPLHDSIRIAEEWSVVDNLSNGRIGLAIASGWHSNDFALNSSAYTDRHTIMLQQIHELRTLWKGSTINRRNGIGDTVPIRIYPKPIQNTLPVWITTGGTQETFIRAGETGAHILTHLLGQELDGLKENIRLYRKALGDNGFDPESGKVTVMLHTFIGDNLDDVKETVKEPFCNYLLSSISLIKGLAGTLGIELDESNTTTLEQIVLLAFERYWQTAALMGTPESCKKIVSQLSCAGVNEIACLIDFGIDNDLIMNSLEQLTKFKEIYSPNSKHDILAEPITMLQSTPSRLKLLVEDLHSQKFLQSLKTLLVGGEVFPEPLKRSLQSKTDARIFNMYGPTETTIWSSSYELTKEWNRISLGSPIGNTEIYVMDAYRNPVPVGMIGEIYIGGPGVVRGYMNQQALTEERFMQHPSRNSRMYRTGDLGRVLDDGTVEFAGRADYQVKLRGYRIELGEIEEVLINHERVKGAIVLVNTDMDGDKELCSYLVCSSQLDPQEIRMFLKKRLPDYMIPSTFVYLEEFPLTPNGKVDRNVLSQLQTTSSSATRPVTLPITETEMELVQIFQDVLKLDRVGVHDNFFELGGHSIKATNIISRMKKQFQIEIPIGVVFERPTVYGLSDYIDSVAQTGSQLAIRAVDERAYYPLSSAQIRMFAFNQMHETSTAYNMPELLEVEGEVDIPHLESVIQTLINRHEALRTYFGFEKGSPVQYIQDNIPYQLQYINYEIKDVSDIQGIYELSVRPFDLTVAPLLRVELWNVNRQHQFLMIDMHHIISDGVSQSILIGELVDLYENQSLERQKLQYKDYSVWQNSMLVSGRFDSQKQYWQALLSGEIPKLGLPTDFPRPSQLSYEGQAIHFTLDKELTDRLRKLSKQHHVTWFMLLLSIFKVLLARLSGQYDIVVGTVTAGRTNEEIENIIGIFLNTLVIRSQPSGHKRFVDLLNEVKAASLLALENQQYPFEAIVDRLGIIPDTNRNPIFDALFIMQNVDINRNHFESRSLILKRSSPSAVPAKVDMKLEAYESRELIHLRMDYMTQLFKRETVERFVEHFITIADSVSRNPDWKLQDIELVSETEKTGMYLQFNDCLDEE